VAPCYAILGVVFFSLIFACFFGANVASIIIAEKYKGSKCEQDLDEPLLMLGILGITSTLLKWYNSLRDLFNRQSPWAKRVSDIVTIIQLYFFVRLVGGAYSMYRTFGFEKKYVCPRTLYLFSFWLSFGEWISNASVASTMLDLL
jgi:hypothetical protein